MIVHSYRIGRWERLRSLVLARLMRAWPFDFAQHPPVAAIVGDYIGDEIRARGRYEDGYLRLLAEKVLAGPNRRVALDIGANIGNHCLFLARHFDQVIAFEPNPVARHLLNANLAINRIDNVSVIAAGLSDREDTATLVVKAGNLGASHVKGVRDDGRAWKDSGEVAIELTTGDTCLDPKARIDFIKLDVEGVEHEVLQGLVGTIRRCRPIVMLEQLGDGVDEVKGTSPSHQFLTKLGYRAFEIQAAPHLGSSILRGLIEAVTGRISQKLIERERLERRNYPALIFLPDRDPGRSD